jgi:hypothetical protein
MTATGTRHPRGMAWTFEVLRGHERHHNFISYTVSLRERILALSRGTPKKDWVRVGGVNRIAMTKERGTCDLDKSSFQEVRFVCLCARLNHT